MFVRPLSCGLSLDRAAQAAVADLDALGDRGGLIAVTVNGDVAMPFDTEVMPRAIWRREQVPVVRIGAADDKPLDHRSPQREAPKDD